MSAACVIASGAPMIGANTGLALAAGAIFGATAGMVGTLALARRRSLLADVAAHASRPGVCLAFLAGEALGLGGRHPLLLLVGACATALLATWSVPRLARLRGVGSDGAIAVTLSFFFGLGAVLLSLIQSHESGAQGGLNHLLYGSAAATTRADLLTVTAIALAALALVALFFKELAALCFDEQHAAVLGIAVRPLDLLLLGLLVATVVAGMQMAGIVLVVAMMIAPAAAARAIRGSLTVVVSAAAAIGAVSAIAGVLISRAADSVPTGSAMTLVAAGIFIASIVATPSRRRSVAA